MKKKITFISDTHTKHEKLNVLLPGGDILICAGDISSSGYITEIENFLKWFDNIDNYDFKIFIAGNHDFGFQDDYEKIIGLLTGYKSVEYLQDERMDILDGEDQQLVIYGTPWQPEFFNWAFNLPRGEKLKEKWDMIPVDTDILITHGPPFGKLDYARYQNVNVGCEELMKRVEEIKPKIHICGHVHSGYGHYFDGHTHYFNASVLNEQYIYTQSPWNVDWNPITNEIVFM
jgi:Icc-related predicted phosphoesterase